MEIRTLEVQLSEAAVRERPQSKSDEPDAFPKARNALHKDSWGISKHFEQSYEDLPQECTQRSKLFRLTRHQMVV